MSVIFYKDLYGFVFTSSYEDGRDNSKMMETIDGGHPHWDGEDIKRQQAVVFGPLGWPGKFVCDVGAW